ncbi:MAG: TonB-dependent receptor [Bacteroidales bacterium]
MLRLLFIISLLFTLLNQTTAQKDTVHAINEVVVYGNRINKEVIPVQILAGEQLKKLSVHSVADAVRYFSGVQIKDYGGIGGLKTINIRSMGSHHVGVFYDGIELGNAQNGVIDLGRFSLDNMEAISMYNGQKSAIFQPAKDFASASSIYMATRTPRFGEGKQNNLNIALKGGSFATINPSLLWEHQFNNKLSSSISAEYMYTSGKYKFRYAKRDGYDTTEVRKNGDVRSLRIEGALFGVIPSGEWKTKVYYYNSERGYPGASVREEPGKFKHQDRQWDDNLFVQGSFRKHFNPRYSLLLNAKYAFDYLHYLSDPNLDITTMHVDNRYKQQESYLSAANMFTLSDWWSASLATDFQWNKLDADLVNFVYPHRYSFLTAGATSLRFERFKFQASVLHTFVKDITKKTGGSAGTKSIFTPTAVASYQPFRDIDLNLRSFYKRIFRMPTLNDLYYTFIGNKELKPEFTNQYDVGITYGKNFKRAILRRIELQTDFYYNQVEDKIIAMPTSNQFRWTMLNLGYVEIRGVDVALQGDWKVRQINFSSRLNYTYQKAQDFTNPESRYYGGQIPYVPWHSGTAILNGNYKGWDVNYSFIYTGERYEAVANIPEDYAQPWYTHDLALSKSIPLQAVTLRITGEVNNIFNQPYEVVQCYPMPGTNFKIKLNITL